MKTPIILLAFANDHPANSGYLRDLPKEMSLLQNILEKAAEKNLCEVILKPNASLEILLDTFRKYRDRIAIFHYAGHAESFELLLREEGKLTKIKGAGLVPIIGQLPALKLLFFNGCTTAQLAQSLNDEGVPAVIGTYQVISDKVAVQLSAVFYQELVSGLPLDLAWRNAISILKTKSNVTTYYQESADNQRGIIKKEAAKGLPLPWDIFYNANNLPLIKAWSLGKAAGNPLFSLPAINAKKYPLPNQPFRFLDRYRKVDAPIFFGRGQEIAALYHKIQDKIAPLILFYGQSGVGKSSLLEAGLLPRIESKMNVQYFRRNAEEGLLKAFLEGVNQDGKEEITSATKLLLFLQKRQSELAEKPLLIILDQVEEVFTSPQENGSGETELNEFLEFIGPVLTNPQLAITVILSFRKEYAADIRTRVEETGINQAEVFIERLSKRGILEVVNGLQTRPQLKSKYQLSIAPELDVEIADDLLADPNSPIAPVLQIILSELWKNELDTKKSFTTEKYRALKAKGFLLYDFFQKQMQKITDWKTLIKSEAADSGLALDILNYHTTEFATSESRDLAHLRKQYEHHSDILDDLLKQFQSTYLLTNYLAQNKEQSTGKSQQVEKTGLAHDTLAPIVQKEMRYSDKPGQRALRTLVAKIVEFDLNEDAFLEEENLALVEAGVNGMRIWTKKEQSLIEKSREIRHKRQQERKRNKIFAIVAAVLILSLAGLSWWSTVQKKKIAEASLWAAKGEIALTENPTKAIALMEKGIEIYPEKAKAEQIALVKRTYATYDSTSFNKGVNLAAMSNDGKFLVYSSSNKAKEGVLFDLINNKEIATLTDAKNNLNTIQFSVDGLTFATAGEDRKIYIYDTNGSLKNTLNKENSIPDESAIIAIKFSNDGQFLASIHKNNRLILWQTNGTSVKVFEKELAYLPSSHDFGKHNEIIVGFSNGNICDFDFNGTEKWCFTNSSKSVLNIDFKANEFLASDENGVSIYSLDMENPPFQKKVDLAIPLTHAQFLFEEDFIIVQQEKKASIIPIKNKTNKEELLGHNTNLVDAVFANKTKQIFTVSRAGELFEWNYKTAIPIQEFKIENDNYFEGIDFQKTDNQLITYREKEIFIWQKNDFFAFLNKLVMHSKSIQNLAISSSGKIGISADKSKILLWETKDGQAQKEQSIRGNKKVNNLAINQNGEQVLFTFERGKKLQKWASQSDETSELEGHNAPITAFIFLKNSQQIISVARDSTAILWKAPNSQILDKLVHPEKNILGLNLSEKEDYLATNTAANFYIWQLSNQSYTQFPKLENTNINCLKWVNDLLYLGTTNGVKVIQFKNDFKEFLHLENLATTINVANFEVVDNQLVTISKEGVVNVW